MGIYAQEAAIIEPYDIEDVFVSGLGRVEFMSSGEARLVFYIERSGEKVAKFGMIMSVDSVVAGMSMFTEALTGSNIGCGLKCLRKQRLI